MPDQNKTGFHIKTYSGSDTVIGGRVLKKGDPVFELIERVEEDRRISEDQARQIVIETAERVVREMFPAIAERVIREEIEKLKKG